jgi:hypothetical protein
MSAITDVCLRLLTYVCYFLRLDSNYQGYGITPFISGATFDSNIAFFRSDKEFSYLPYAIGTCFCTAGE